MNARCAALVFAAALLALPATGSAKGRKGKARGGKAACGAKYLPLIKGAVLEYEWIAPEKEPPGPKAIMPTVLRIEVKEVVEKGKTATITLVESYRKHSQETTITCAEDGFQISPQSFFFVGEPGGGIGLELEDLKREGPDLPGPRDFRLGLNWTAFIKAKAIRKATEGSGAVIADSKLEIDRELFLQRRELVESAMGVHTAYRVDVSLSGRASVTPALDKWVDLPPASVVMWYTDGLGMVRTHNRYGHGWMLKSRTLPGDEDE